MSYAWLSIVPSFKKSLIVEQFQRNYLKRSLWFMYTDCTYSYFLIEKIELCISPNGDSIALFNLPYFFCINLHLSLLMLTSIPHMNPLGAYFLTHS